MKKIKINDMVKAFIFSMTANILFVLAAIIALSVGSYYVAAFLCLPIMALIIVVMAKVINMSDIIIDHWDIVWYAVDKSGCGFLYSDRPVRGGCDEWVCDDRVVYARVNNILRSSLPDITWEDDPVVVRVTIKREI